MVACVRASFLYLPRGLLRLQSEQRMRNEKSFPIRSYRGSDRGAVRKLCCQPGFLGAPIDPVYEDRQMFAAFLTTSYTDHEPEPRFSLELDGVIQSSLLGSPKRYISPPY